MTSIDHGTRELILELLRVEPRRPTEILENLTPKQQASAQVRDALAVLLDTGVIEMGADRRLHLAKAAAA